MTKPKYMAELLKIIFLWCGIPFILMGLFCFIGILGPTADSALQTPTILGIIFLSLGIAFLVVQFVLKGICLQKTKLHHELLTSGTKINGTVENVRLQAYAQYGKQSPYVIFYTYTHLGNVYHHKSDFLWEKPFVTEHDPVVVYANDAGDSTISL